VAQAVDAMAAIEQSSQQIAQIINVIDSIAFSDKPRSQRRR
jgi:methyl-accepting chemotaxis protein